MFDSFSFLEQSRTDLGDSKLELCWNSFTGKYGIRTTKITQFDPYSTMSRQPEKYILDGFKINNRVPTDAWIEKALSVFIRDEFSDKSFEEIPHRFAPVVEEEIYLDDSYLLDFLNQSEWPNLTSLELPKDNSVESMAESIFRILCKEEIGSTKNRRNVNRTSFIKQISSLLYNKKRLFFVLPGCPFKDQNRFRVPYNASCPDFGEISFLIRLHNLVQALYQVHPYGGQAIILSDGRLYQDIFHVSSTDVEEYQWRLKHYRNILNLQGGISIIDLKEMIDRANDEGILDTIFDSIKNRIKNTYLNNTKFNVLVKGMKWNIDSKRILSHLSDEDAWSVIRHERADVKASLLDEWDEYSRVSKSGGSYYSDSDNAIVRLLQKAKGIYTRESVNSSKGD